MEHVIFSSLVLDSCSNIYGVTISGMSFVSNARGISIISLTALHHRHWVLKISTVSLSRALLEMLFNRVLYPTDAWNMVSNTRCFPFLVAQGTLNRCSNTRIVRSSPYPVGPTNLYTCITLAYSHPGVRLSACFSFGGHSPSFSVISSSRAYRDLFQYITGYVSLLFAARDHDVDDFGFSDQNSYAVRRGRQPRGMQASPRSGGRDMQVTVTKTIEFDVELRLESGQRVLPGEEGDFYSRPLTEEEQQIQTLELQMKHDLEI
jgi:hypothetical protein